MLSRPPSSRLGSWTRCSATSSLLRGSPTPATPASRGARWTTRSSARPPSRTSFLSSHGWTFRGGRTSAFP
eukprot:288007-Pyramimonas_sp.AAC.1